MYNKDNINNNIYSNLDFEIESEPDVSIQNETISI